MGLGQLWGRASPRSWPPRPRRCVVLALAGALLPLAAWCDVCLWWRQREAAARHMHWPVPPAALHRAPGPPAAPAPAPQPLRAPGTAGPCVTLHHPTWSHWWGPQLAPQVWHRLVLWLSPGHGGWCQQQQVPEGTEVEQPVLWSCPWDAAGGQHPSRSMVAPLRWEAPGGCLGEGPLRVLGWPRGHPLSSPSRSHCSHFPLTAMSQFHGPAARLPTAAPTAQLQTQGWRGHGPPSRVI